MSYRRVIPRDLFNEANLLKCLGRLSILLDEIIGHDAELTNDGGPFDIQQNPASGAISCINVDLVARGRQIWLSRPLNSREPWPLYADDENDETVAVFTDDGFFTPEFKQMIGL